MEHSVSECREATLACFLRSDKGELFAVTAGHVTRSTRYVCVHSKELGVCDTENAIDMDVGAVKIHRENESLCKNDVFDPAGRRRSVKNFKGKISDLYNKQVFKCIPQHMQKMEDTNLKRCNHNTPLTGLVASKEVHERNKDILGESYFLVASNSNEQFAKEGESGTLLAVDEGDSDISLIGIISGGLNPNSSFVFITCSFLPKAINDFQLKTKTRLILQPIMNTVYKREFKDNNIICGDTITFKRPEKVSPLDFEIDEKMMFLLCFKLQEDDSSKITLITDYERRTRKKVFAREEINEMAMYSPEGAEQVTLLYFYLTVQNLYALEYEKAKQFLKEAMRSLLKVKYSLLRLLCKCMTYVTWLYLSDDIDEFQLLEQIFEEGLKFLIHYKDLPQFPRECLGYHYYDYSRFYSKRREKSKASEKAKLCYETLKVVYEENTYISKVCEQDAFNRFVFGLCQYTQTLLWCGENFDFIDEDVQLENIQKSEELIKSVENRINDAPAVQKVSYLLSMCDLHYRKNELPEAFDIANQCLKQAKECHMVEEQYAAGCRCRELRKKIKVNNKMKNNTRTRETRNKKTQLIP